MKRSGFTPLENYIKNRRRSSLTGFTFIELIISITIFTIIITTVYSAFNMGIKTWRKGEAQKSLQKVRMALLKIEKDIKNTFFFSGVFFTGTSTEMEFPLTISEEDKERIYRITYSVEAGEGPGLKALVRKEEVHPEYIEEESKQKILLSSVKSIKFEYAYESSDLSQDFGWREYWYGTKEEKLPSGVRVSIEMDESNEIYNKVIFLQQGELGAK